MTALISPSKRTGKTTTVARRGLAHARGDVDEALGNVREQDALLLERALPDEALLELVGVRERSCARRSRSSR